MADTILTDDERQTIQAALPELRRTSPEAARLVRRLVQADVKGQVATTDRFASVAEVATAFGVTQQTIRNWADRGWLPCQRTLGGARRFAPSVLASAHALARPRPAMPDLSAEQIEAIINAPRRKP